jgi:hypothetical protein
MSRYTLTETDLVATVGMDFTFQLWVVDHRGMPLPLERPAKMTVVDRIGQTLFETADGPADNTVEATIALSTDNGLAQVTIPRALSDDWFPSIHSWDHWATIYDGESQGSFPKGQQIPLARGRFIIQPRNTVLEDQ